MEGFEPPHGGTKNRCLTAWRHPINFDDRAIRLIVAFEIGKVKIVVDFVIFLQRKSLIFCKKHIGLRKPQRGRRELTKAKEANDAFW